MEPIFTRTWFIGTVAAWILILALDEVAYYWWKDMHPGSQWTGIIIKHPLTNDQQGGIQ